MDEFTPEVRDWLRTHRHAVLITLRRDGSPQSSNVLTTYDGEVFRVSVTADRAKTHNLRRDPRALLHLLGDSFWQYGSIGCRAEVGPVTQTPGDEVGRALLEVYEGAAGQAHPDPEEFLTAQVEDRRLVLTLHPQTYVGSGV